MAIVQLEADLPPARRVAEGSSPNVFATLEGLAIPVEVRLRRRDVAPSSDQVDDVRAWLRVRRERAVGTQRPAPALAPVAPPVPVLQPLVRVEPPRRGTVWPLCAVSLGLAAALIAAILV